MEDNIRTSIHNNPGIVFKLFSLVFLIFGFLAVIGAIKNWDWLYAPDGHYQNNWNMGQVSRYLGRSAARVIGFILGLLIIIAGAVWTYKAFF